MLVHKLSRQTLLQESESESARSMWTLEPPPLSDEGPGATISTADALTQPLLLSRESYTPVDCGTPAGASSITAAEMQMDSCSQEVTGDWAMDDAPPCMPGRYLTIARWQSAARLRRSSSSLKTLGLMTEMVANGVQCNVQAAAPPTPSTSSLWPSYIEPDDRPDQGVVPTVLENDLGYREEGGDAPHNDFLGLRHPGTSQGVRKSGLLHYRRSSEAAKALLIERTTARGLPCHWSQSANHWYQGFHAFA
ncbi:hypothetical protein GGR56DRAFT_591917 [Xylariaceae sp. FL0804]|nr:hypothetical protein GGR56DRAFT_591917 [Xylariaceae sp. FL0804]